MSKTKYHFQVIYQVDPNGSYIAHVPALPGCHTQGKTLEQAETRIKEAIEAYLLSLRADKQKFVVRKEKIFLGSVTV